MGHGLIYKVLEIIEECHKVFEIHFVILQSLTSQYTEPLLVKFLPWFIFSFYKLCFFAEENQSSKQVSYVQPTQLCVQCIQCSIYFIFQYCFV